MLGGIRKVEPLEVVGESRSDGAGAAVSARVIGARDSARAFVDLGVAADRWVVLRASAILSDGRRLPLEGTHRPLLEPPGDGR